MWCMSKTQKTAAHTTAAVAAGDKPENNPLLWLGYYIITQKYRLSKELLTLIIGALSKFEEKAYTLCP